MEKNKINKNDFLYSKKDSITEELCQEIMEQFEDDIKSNPYLFTYNQNETILEIPNDYKKCPFYGKLKSYLTKELNKNMEIYKNRVIKTYKPFQPNNQYQLTIKKIVYDDTQFETKKTHEKKTTVSSNKDKMFYFVWVLNDCSFEYIFWKEYRMQSTMGSLFIFPVSWCFPYEEIGAINQDQYIITGYMDHF